MVLSRRSFSLAALAACACRPTSGAAATGPAPEPAFKDLDPDPATVTPITHTDAEWKAALDDKAYQVLRHEDTEYAFTGRYWDEHRSGTFVCAGCNLRLFGSADKFDSGTGWPSFTRPYKTDRVKEKSDASFGMVRIEVECARCGGHLGHVFDDGPAPTGLRYCINSASLVFRAA